MAYNKDTDYSLLIKDAVSKGDYRSAAKYEQQRNEKISGEGLGYETTNNYTNWSDSFGGSATGVGVWTQDQDAIRQMMNEKSKQWFDADEATRAILHAENEYLASLLGGDVAFDPKTGYWGGNAAGTAAQQAAGMMMPSFSYDVAKPTYESNYASRIDTLLNQILNREDFSYDVESDPLYQQYKDQYNREGDRSMRDTLAEAASGAGGMNSYAVSAAQQANNYYAAQLTDKIPELYQLAYQMYLNDLDNQVRDLGLLQDMDNTQYGRYRDTMSDWYNDRDFAYGQYRDDMSDYKWSADFNYGASRDEIEDEWRQKEFDNDYYWRDKEFSYGSSQDDYNKALAKAETLAAYGDFSGYKALGYSDEEIAKMKAAWDKENAVVVPPTRDEIIAGTGLTDVYIPDSVKENATGTYGNDGLSTEQIKELQAYYGVEADGKWGTNSRAAANGWSAKKAWESYQAAKAMPEIQGKDFIEYESAASNYADMKRMCEELYKTDGKDAVLAMLREARSTGVLNLNEYSALYSKYRDMN